MDPFASHVVRALLALLCPNLFPPEKSSTMRSKKSAAYKAKQGPLKSVFTNDSDVFALGSSSVPKELLSLTPRFVTALRENLSENEIRALAANQVASPVLQVNIRSYLFERYGSDGHLRCSWKSKQIDKWLTNQVP